ncbi:MAG: DUF86 domain-containing protein [Nitrospirae bacterium]|nr:DUF86 domain-containing protein [Nitrospirota bacterium]MCL5237904.1 DUF86 domain-containing protein [Nitrospirota bacterium]
MEEIKAKIAVVQERVRRLSKFKELSFESYLKDSTVKDAVERNIEVAVQACIDIARIIIKRERLREPEDNKGVFVVLAENGLIGEDSLRFLVPMAGTRNILVHGYDKIDDAIILGVLKKHLSDFNLFLKDIEKNYLKKK